MPSVDVAPALVRATSRLVSTPIEVASPLSDGRGSLQTVEPRASASGRTCTLHNLGRVSYQQALDLQARFVNQRKQSEIGDQLLILEHPHVITMGRNGHAENLLADTELLAHAGIEFHHTNRGGDVTYHGPGQIIGYPIIDLREWKCDVVAYVRALEEMVIQAIAEFGIPGKRVEGATGVWVETPHGPAKVAAIGVHISRWVTSHGFALNLDPDLSYYRYIVPCGLTKPVTSLRAMGLNARREEVVEALFTSFARVFDREIRMENL